MITFTDGGSRDHIRREDIKTLQEQFDFMLAVGVGPSARDEELRMLSTKGRSIHVKEYNGELLQFSFLISNKFSTRRFGRKHLTISRLEMLREISGKRPNTG